MKSRYLVTTGQSDLVEQIIDLPDLAAKDALIRFRFCGLCGSDLSTFEGRRPVKRPISLGHEFVAVIEAVGNQVENVRIGDIVVSDLNWRCGKCAACHRNQSHLCESGQKSRFTNRGFAEQAVIDSTYLTKVGIDQAHPYLAYAEPLSCVLHALQNADPHQNDSVLVLGAGSLGTSMSMALRDHNQPASYYDPMAARLDGVVSRSDLFGVWDQETQMDIVIELTGTPEGLQTALRAVRRGGRVVSMSHLDGYQVGDFVLPALTRRDVWFIVSYLNGDGQHLPRALDIIDQTPREDFERWTRVVPLSSAEAVIANRRETHENKVVFAIA